MAVKIQEYKNKDLLTDDQVSTLEKDLYFLEEKGIPHVVCHAPIGHINIYHKKKVVISYYSYSGTIYDREFHAVTKGVVNCINHYMKYYGNKV